MECCNSSEVTREHFSAVEEASALEDVSSPIGRLVGRCFLFLELLEQQRLGEVLHVEHSKGSRLGLS